MRASPLNTLAQCTQVGINADPASVSVTGLSLTIQYDPSIYTFDQADSGPLGIYSVGGDAPPVDPGIGIQPVQTQPSTGDSPGAPLPGLTLTYTNVGGLLTVNYQLASPLTQTSDLNFFLVEFDFVNPVFIDLSRSTAAYATSGPGADFSVMSFTCTATALTGGCGSDNPSTGVSFQLAEVPEPSTLFMLGPVSALALVARHRKRHD